MRVHNTESGRLEEFVPRVPGRVDMYVCGPTVYGPPHLGHARTTISFDMIRRYLRFAGFDVLFVSNFTDIDDKIIKRAAEEGLDASTVAQRYERVWLERMRRLRVAPPDRAPHATQYVAQMIEMIGALVDGGYAYAAGGDVYFSCARFPEYGRLSHQPLAELAAGARVEPGENKRDPVDFALWKGAKPDEPAWDSPWGPGRPGWHIECSVMAVGELGMGFDIHGAGNDLIFPHHENEIAQSEAATGLRPFVRYWLHSGMVNLEGEKMAKSTGLFVSLDDILARSSAEAIRLLVAQTHYRNPIDFAPPLVAENESAVGRLAIFRDRCAEALGTAVPGEDPLTSDAVLGAAPDPIADMAFRAAMDDDFHTPGAVAALFDLVKRGNTALDGGDASGAQGYLRSLADFDSILGVVPPPEGADAALVDGLVRLVLQLRGDARSRKDFAAADLIRNRLTEVGVVVEDTPQGARWRRGRRPAAGG